MSDLAEIRKEIAWLKEGLRKVADLGISTEKDCSELKAGKRTILFVNGGSKAKTNTRWVAYKEAAVQAREKQENDTKVEKKEEESSMDTEDDKKKKRPHFGTELILDTLGNLKTVLKQWEGDESKSEVLCSGLSTILSEVHSRDPSRLIRYAFPHTEKPVEGASWAWTLHWCDNESATYVREAMIYDLQPLMRKQDYSMKADRPSAEGGKQTRAVREHFNMPKPKSRAKPRKRGAGPASPLKAQ